MTVERGLAGKRKIIIQGEGDESNGGYDQNISCPCMRLSKDQKIKKYELFQDKQKPRNISQTMS